MKIENWKSKIENRKLKTEKEKLKIENWKLKIKKIENWSCYHLLQQIVLVRKFRNNV